MIHGKFENMKCGIQIESCLRQAIYTMFITSGGPIDVNKKQLSYTRHAVQQNATAVMFTCKNKRTHSL